MEANFKSRCWAVGHQNPQFSSQPCPCKDLKPRTNLPKMEPQISRVTMTTSESQILRQLCPRKGL